MDISSILSSIMSGGGSAPWSFAPQPGAPASNAPGAPMNILPQVAQTAPTKVGLLNGATLPEKDNSQRNNMMAQMGMQMLNPKTHAPQMPQIQMARPAGAGPLPPPMLAGMLNQG